MKYGLKARLIQVPAASMISITEIRAGFSFFMILLCFFLIINSRTKCF